MLIYLRFLCLESNCFQYINSFTCKISPTVLLGILTSKINKYLYFLEAKKWLDWKLILYRALVSNRVRNLPLRKPENNETYEYSYYKPIMNKNERAP